MSDRDALLAAIRAHPDEDTPRLVYADYLEEHDAPARAAFVRTQVEYARTPPWEPFAVRLRWRQPDTVSGKPFVKDLPPVPGSVIEWPSEPFRRGFAWALTLHHASMWDRFAEPLFEQFPLGKLFLSHGTLDDWVRVGASGSVRQLRELVFNVSPIEPLLVLRDKPDACGVTDLHFRRASGAGMPEVIEDLLRAPLGRAVRGLHFHTGYESLNDLIDALNTGGPLERLSFSVMGLTADLVRRLFDGPAGSALTALRVRDERLGDEGLHALAETLPAGLSDLELSKIDTRGGGLEALARCDRLAGLQRLNMSRNPLTPRAAKVLAQSRVLAGLRSLDLSECGIDARFVRHVVHSKFWWNLVELDLRKNPLAALGVKHLLDAPVPPGLAALALDGDALGGDSRLALIKKYGEAVRFVANEVQGW
ncbi:TIGR02996 domain-containing protein [Frigoriglobus tundricola]|uniref:TIGR02996 domain-containing protein n=1 Tax=Frigoriglobus tundricola TaxID=2774151 RepID=A0A6M5YM60_9BACT|nr:TIGR02996 domain-containing protein [Frigoriglobus tundricola]QJW95015.1 hypothetical protein FTUN_2541 [Frigoriglobus tundricola]